MDLPWDKNLTYKRLNNGETISGRYHILKKNLLVKRSMPSEADGRDFFRATR